MNSITYGIGYFLAILVVNVFSADLLTIMSEEKVKHNGQYSFSYEKNKVLFMQITLKNISPSVTAVQLVYDYQNNYGHSVLSERVNGNIEKNTREVKFMILKDLTYDAIVVAVELHNDQAICDTINIAEARSVDTMRRSAYNKYYTYMDPTTYVKQYIYKWSDDCLAPKPCEIVTDLGNKCQEPPPSTDYSCIIEASQYINCTFIKQATYNRIFYQTYDNNSYIGPAREIKRRTIKLFIKLELFDNKTTVNVAPYGSPSSKTKVIWSSDRLNLTAKDIREDNNVKELRYSETTDVQYSCKDYGSTEVRVSLINTDNKITTLKETTINRPFKMAESGTILCCLYYKTISKRDQEVHISRVVENKTLLIYQSQESTNLTGADNKTSEDSPGADNKASDESVPVVTIIVLAVGLVVGVILSCFITILIIKCRRVKSNTAELPQTYVPENPFYVNLLLRRECQQEIYEREHHYEEIN